MANTNYDWAREQANKGLGEFWDTYGNEKKKAQGLYENVQGKYEGMTGPRGAMEADSADRAHAKFEEFGDTGGYKDTGNLYNRIHGVQETGGYDPEVLAGLRAQYADLGGIGGINEEQAAKIRGGYGGLIDTGGISETTAEAMRRRSASGVESVYSTLGADLARRRAVQGGFGGGGETAQMARQMSGEQAKAVTGTEAEIGKLRQGGTIAGLGGLSEFERAAGEARRAGLAEGRLLEGGVAAGRREGVGQEITQQGAEARNRIEATQSQANMLAEEGRQRITAAGGLQRLYESDPGYVRTMIQSILQQQQIGGQLSTAQAQIMAELSKQPGLFQNIMQGVQAVANVAATVAP